ncbi:MAG TPA: tRNA adenosine deaminase-associated protein [Acidothermaceae bacterium]
MSSDRRAGGAAESGGRVFAVVCSREEGQWEIGLLPGRASSSLEAFLAAVRQQPGDGGALGFVDVADDFFVATRITGDGVRLLLSDVTAADEWPFARQVLDRLGLPEPSDEDFDDIVPAGDLAIFADLGLPELELGLLLSDVDAYADEMLVSIARRLGFGDEFERLVDAGVH